jgi:DHA2 family multidrug resistance protein-like MFS transporter
MSLLFTMASVDAAPRVGLGIGAVLTMVAGLVSTLRVRPMAIGAPRV